MLKQLAGIQGLNDHISALGVSPKDPPALRVSAAEFILEGLYARKRIGRSEEFGFVAGEKRRMSTAATMRPGAGPHPSS